MKIISVNEELSSEHNLEIKTDPKLDKLVFDYFQMQAKPDPRLKDITFSQVQDSDLILHSTALVNAAIPDGLGKIIEDYLTKAESIAADEVAAKKKKTDHVANQRKEIIRDAAKKLGIPVK